VTRLSDLSPEAQDVAVTDVPGDQGGAVEVLFQRSRYDDVLASEPVVRYDVLRDDPSPAERTLVATLPATGNDYYAVVAPTRADSTRVAGMYLAEFVIRAATANPLVYYDAAPVPGYSVDNLPPTPPANVSYGAGVLAWDPPSEPDFQSVRVFGSHRKVFDSLAVLIGETAQTFLDVTGSPHSYYLLAAADRAGNESAFVSVVGEPDQISPVTPASFLYTDGILSWNASPDLDLDHYAVYGAMVDTFATAAPIAETPATSMDVNAAPYLYYFITALDGQGNARAAASTPRRDEAPQRPSQIVLPTACCPGTGRRTLVVRYAV
jgi:hypothetical protein